MEFPFFIILGVSKNRFWLPFLVLQSFRSCSPWNLDTRLVGRGLWAGGSGAAAQEPESYQLPALCELVARLWSVGIVNSCFSGTEIGPATTSHAKFKLNRALS